MKKCTDLLRHSTAFRAVVSRQSPSHAWLRLLILVALAAVPTLANAEFDHVQCYKIKDQANISVDLMLAPFQSPFVDSQCKITGRAKMLCVPASGSEIEFEERSALGLQEIPFGGDPLQWYKVCYRVRCEEPAPVDSEIASDCFGTRVFSRFRYHMVCGPAVLGGPPPDSICGTFLTAWGNSGPPQGRLDSPHAIAIDEALDAVFVTDLGTNRVLRFSRNGTLEAAWGGGGSGDGEFDQPSGIAVSADGEVFVVDRGNARVQAFDADGNFIAKWGSPGNGEREFDDPQSIAAGPGGVLYVTDKNNHRVQKFDTNGLPLGEWGTQGVEDGEFEFPEGIHVTAAGDVYVADTGNHRIQIFSGDGVHQSTWGGPGPGAADGEFRHPEGVAGDASGNIYVSDHDNDRIQMFDADPWSFRAKWGESGEGNGQFALGPHGLAVSSGDDDAIVYVVDSGNNRIQKFYCDAE